MFYTVYVERPQKNMGVERISRVVEFDENGKELRDVPGIAYEHDFFAEDFSEAGKLIARSLARTLHVDTATLM